MNWPPFVIGVVAVVSGTLGLIFRGWLARTIASFQRATFGQAGEFVASRSTPNGLIAPGVISILMGAALILLSLFYHKP
jgi:hypothetical protein